MPEFELLPRRQGRIEYRHRQCDDAWGVEEWRMTRGADGLRVLSAHCEMRLGPDWVVRDSVQSMHADYHPRDAYVRIMRDGELTGSGWFAFTDDEAICESLTRDEGRISQRFPIQRPIRGFGMHAVQSDAWLAAPFPYEKGPGHVQFFGRNLLHSTHHFGATGPFIATTGSGLEYVGPETIEVAAGQFDCHRIRFVGLTNDHPEYHLWVTRDGDFLYVKGLVEGYIDSVFELIELSGEPL
jgi:hypothetical protein